jgi:serine/threonine protein kinase
MWRPPDFPSWWVKIADFGISKRFEEDADGTTVLQGTPKFMAPELIFRKHKPLREQKPRDHFAADIWAVGCTIWYMFTKTVPFQDWSALSAYYERNAWGSMPELPSEVCDDMGQTFVKNLLYADPDDRPNAEGCLDFAWLHKFSRDDVDEDDDAAQ